MIAYVNDFWLVMVLTIAAIPLLVLMRPTPRSDAPQPATAHMD
jgi:DHA2 family multidrug resistance protein